MATNTPALREVLVLHHSHSDVGYTHPQPVFWELQRRYIDQAIELCELTADWPEPSRMRWTCEVTGTLLDWLRHASSSRIERFRALVRAGQLDAGAMFGNGTPLSTAEQLARTLYPVRELRETLGLPLRVAVNHDINGLPWPWTQLLLDAGMEMCYMGINAYYGGYPSPRPRAFRWRGSDGRDLLTWNGEHYSVFGCVLVGRPGLCEIGSTDLMAEALERHFRHLAATGYPYDFVFLTATHAFFDDNNPPHLKLAEMIRRWNEEDREPLIRFATPEDLLQRLKKLPGDSVPVQGGDWTDYWNFGAGSSALQTKVNRHTARRLAAVEMMCTQTGARSESQTKQSREAWWNLNLYDEHTWGIAHPLKADPETTAEQWNHKAHFAFQAKSLAGLMLRDQAELLAGNPPEAESAQGLLFVNTAPIARRTLLPLSPDMVDGSWKHFSSRVHRFDAFREITGEAQRRWVGPVELPPCGWCVLPIDQLPTPAPDSDLQTGENYIESPFHRLEFDPKTGHVTSLLDKERQWDVVDSDSPFPFFGFVHEHLDPTRLTDEQRKEGGRRAFFQPHPDPLVPRLPAQNWNPDWPALRDGPSMLLSARVQRGAGSVSLVLEWEAPGVTEFTQRITLFAHRPAIELTATFRKTDNPAPEAVYFAFPVRLASWRAYFDTAGVPLEFDREQLPGVCRDWLTVGQWAAMADERHGITLSCPDAPLVQVGGFNFGRAGHSPAPGAEPILLSWVMNNYWHTNFRVSQPGPVRFRYELTTHGPYDPVASTEAGMEAAFAVEVHPVILCAEASNGRFLEVKGDGVFSLGLKPAEDGNDMVLRLVNVREDPAEAAVRLPGRLIKQAWKCNSLEENLHALDVEQGAVRLNMKGRAVIALRLAWEEKG